MTMATVPPGRNRIVQAAFEGLRKEQRAEKKADKAEPPAPVKKAAPAKKAAAKKGRRK